MPEMNFQQEGKRHSFVAPADVTAGDFVLVEGALVHALTSADSGDEFKATYTGVHRNVPADDDDDFDNFAVVYWNDTDGKLFAADDGGAGDGHPAVGRTFGAKAESADTCSVLLSPFS